MKIDVVQIELRKSHKIEIPLEFERIYTARQAGLLFCNTIGSLNVENAAVVCLDNANQIINYFIVSIGENNAVKVSLAQLFRIALLSNASKIMVAHNHPTGILEISRDDIEMTRKIGFFAKAFCIELLDSVIVNSDGFISIREHCKEFSDE